jgi:OmpA-OmpF porin, OOP family
MRLMQRCVMTLVGCLALLAGSAHAQEDEFDADFGVRPAPAKAGSAAPSMEPEPAPEAPPPEEVAEPAPIDDETPAPPKPEEPPSLTHNSVGGPVGGIHTVSAGSGKPGTFRFALTADFFRKDDFLVSGSEARHGGTALSLSITPIEHLELAAQITAIGTEHTAGNPRVVQVVGDSRLYAKGYHRLRPWLDVGGDLEIALHNAIGAMGYQANATSVALRANATFDLRKLEKKPFPLIARTSLRYYFDNSAKLIPNLEQARYNSLTNPAQMDSEWRHLVTNVERFEYRLNRVDAMNLSFGFEVPLAPGKDILISPLLEWTVALPINRQDYNCLVTSAAEDNDSCLAGEDFSARLSTLSLGLRGQPKVPGLGILLAVDIATSGAKNSVRELAPNAPYLLYLGLSYEYDAFVKREPPPPVVQRVEVPIELPKSHIRGLVLDRQELTPVAHALVHFEGSELSDIATDTSGRFLSYPLKPGPHALTISATDYESATCSATLPDVPGDVDLRCELQALPKQGSLRGRVMDPAGKPVAGAQIELSGAAQRSLTSDSNGDFNAGDLAQGDYGARVEAPGFLLQVVPLTVRPRSESAAMLTLVPKPARSLVSLTPKKIAIKQQVQFVQGSAEIAPASNGLLSEIADVLLRNRDIAKVEVQGHTDNSGSEEVNRELSERRAAAVRDWLLKAGVESERLSAAGYGSARPLAPNITVANKARNRRVELMILEMR